VGALVPYQHKDLIDAAMKDFQKFNADEDANQLQIYRDKQIIWNEERTVIIYISNNLKAGQMRGMYHSLERIEKNLNKLQSELSSQKSKKRKKETLEKEITKIVKGQFIKNIVIWELKEVSTGKFELSFSIDNNERSKVEDHLGFRILMTDRHDWETDEIINAYQGQAHVEQAFKNIKNPYHLTLKPQFHWTDQKIKVHYFICVLGYLLATLAWREAKIKCQFTGTLNTLLNRLNDIRLATLLEESKKKGKYKAIYKLEEMEEEETSLMEALAIKDFHTLRPKLRGVGVYTDSSSI